MKPITTMLAATFGALLLAAPAGALAGAAAPPNLPACPSKEDKPAVAPVLKRIEQTMEGSSSSSTMTMSIKTKSWSRSLKMKVSTKGRSYALIRILEGGPRETGMMTLKREKQLWNYLPQAGRVVKLPSGMLGDSWMGSDFTNDDLVRGSSMVDDFDSRVVGTATHDGRDVWRIVLEPKPKAVVVWGKIEMLVERASCVPLHQRFYDEDGKVARTMSFGDIRSIGWRRFPARMAITPADGARETIVTYENIEFDVSVPDDTFSLHRLQQGR
jgi:outer membrane lipoprotein-sorting protein